MVWLSAIVEPVKVPRLTASLAAPVRVAMLSMWVSLALIRLVTVVLKFASSPRAAASSFNVLRALGDPSMRVDSSCCTNAVVASWVVLVDPAAVGAAGVPVKVGEAMSAFRATAAVVALASS